MISLKPCPFCGNEAPEVGYQGFCDPRYHVKCYTCPAIVYGDSEENAAERWNSRGLSQEDREALDAGSTALHERGEFHIYKDGKVYTRHECNEMAAILRRLGGQTT